MRDERLQALINLQEQITKRYDLYRQHETIPERQEALRDQIKQHEDLLEQAKLTARENDLELARSRREVAKIEENQSDLQTKLNQVKTTREYEARQRELKSHRDRLNELSGQIEELEGRKPELEAAATQAAESLAELHGQIDPQLELLEGQAAEYELALEDLQAEEQKLRNQVPGDLLERLDRLVMLRTGRAVVPVNESSCGGCGVRLSPQVIQLAKRGLDLIQCDRCSVYLYWDEDEDADLF